MLDESSSKDIVDDGFESHFDGFWQTRAASQIQGPPTRERILHLVSSSI